MTTGLYAADGSYRVTQTDGNGNTVAPNTAVAPTSNWSFAGATGGIVSTTTAVTVKTAAATGIRNYVTGIQVSTDTLGTATELAIRDGAAGTVLWRTKLQTTALPTININFATPLKGTAATLLEIVTLTSSTGGVYVNLNGYTAA